MNWLKKGDRNTKFFHSFVKGRRKKLSIQNIEDSQGRLLEYAQEIGEEAINIFKEQFSKSNEYASTEALDIIPKLLSYDDRKQMDRRPEEEEIWIVVFDLNKDSASGPDGYSRDFYQSCWEIIKGEVVNAVSFFFCGAELPRYITHTTLVLILKKEMIWSFNNLRPISLSSFINKIIPRLY